MKLIGNKEKGYKLVSSFAKPAKNAEKAKDKGPKPDADGETGAKGKTDVDSDKSESTDN